MEHICYEERLELFILEKFLGNLVTAQLSVAGQTHLAITEYLTQLSLACSRKEVNKSLSEQ